MGQLSDWAQIFVRVFAWWKPRKSRKFWKMGLFFKKKSLKMGTLPAKINLTDGGRGFEARAAHPCPTQIWVPPPRTSHCNRHAGCAALGLMGRLFTRNPIFSRGAVKYKNASMIAIFFTTPLNEVFFHVKMKPYRRDRRDFLSKFCPINEDWRKNLTTRFLKESVSYFLKMAVLIP